MMIIAFAQPLFAVDVLQIFFGVVALIFLVLRQLAEANKQAGVKSRPPVAAQPQPQAPPQAKGAAAPAGQQADPLRAQVEEFLRRAGQMQQQGKPKPPQRPPQPAKSNEAELRLEPVQPDAPRTFGQPLRQAQWRTAPTSAAPAPAKPAPQSIKLSEKTRTARGPAKPPRRKSVAEHVAEQVTAHSRNLSDKASQLGQRIVAEDQQFDVQLKAKFDHTVGTLADSAVPSSADQAPPPSNSPAAQLASMLINPTGIQQAMLLNEILRRPSERW